jgi:hypothetical protein
VTSTRGMKRIGAFTAIAIACTGIALPRAMAQRPADTGPEVAVRAGLAVPFGQVQGGMNQNLDRYVSTAIPLGIEAGYRIVPALFVGVRFHYAFPQLKNPGGNCDDVSCDGSGVQLGLEAIYRFMPESKFAPWVGLGAGYEWWTADYFTSNAGLGATVSGFQGLLQAGGDVRVGPQLALGPFLEVATGRFDSSTGRVRIGNTTNSTDSDISDTAWHTWLTLGVRGAFGF